MRPDDVRRLLRQQPFRPFRIYVLETTIYEVRHRDFAFVTPFTITIMSLLHIAKLEPLASGV